MKVKILIGILLIVCIGISLYIGITVFSSDTDTIRESFYETIDVISVRGYPSVTKLLIIVYEYYDPECGCYEEVSILVNPHEYRSYFENLKTPITIKMRGTKVNSVYNIEWIGS